MKSILFETAVLYTLVKVFGLSHKQRIVTQFTLMDMPIVCVDATVDDAHRVKLGVVDFETSNFISTKSTTTTRAMFGRFQQSLFKSVGKVLPKSVTCKTANKGLFWGLKSQSRSINVENRIKELGYDLPPSVKYENINIVRIVLYLTCNAFQSRC